jgi:hypothetical protein
MHALSLRGSPGNPQALAVSKRCLSTPRLYPLEGIAVWCLPFTSTGLWTAWEPPDSGNEISRTTFSNQLETRCHSLLLCLQNFNMSIFHLIVTVVPFGHLFSQYDLPSKWAGDGSTDTSDFSEPFKKTHRKLMGPPPRPPKLLLRLLYQQFSE